ncbi:MAG: hypothetical protein ABR576_16415, partial [Thermoanaerobaculia bacterium]
MTRKTIARFAAASIATFLSLAAVARAQNHGFTTEFRLQECRFRASGVNPHFIPLKPSRFVYEAEEDGEIERLEITVLDDFERIHVPGLGLVRTRVIGERETVDGELVEVSRNFYAICGKRNDVVYFGEKVDIFHEDGSVTHEGEWRAGQPDARGVAHPGIIMPGTFLLGSRYYQELADGIALDRAEHVAMGLVVNTPAGRFRDCVRVVETTPLEPGSESVKVYCPRVGLVMDNELTLIEY